jgi:hypothetical protein
VTALCVRSAARPLDRWLQIFYDTVDGGWSGPDATTVKKRAAGMAWVMASRFLGKGARRPAERHENARRVDARGIGGPVASGKEVVVITEIELRGANCPVCFETVRTKLLEDARVSAVHSSFSEHHMRIERHAMSDEELFGLLHRNLHGVEIAGNGERVMVDVKPTIGEWHCHG